MHNYARECHCQIIYRGGGCNIRSQWSSSPLDICSYQLPFWSTLPFRGLLFTFSLNHCYYYIQLRTARIVFNVGGLFYKWICRLKERKWRYCVKQNEISYDPLMIDQNVNKHPVCSPSPGRPFYSITGTGHGAFVLWTLQMWFILNCKFILIAAQTCWISKVRGPLSSLV